MSDLVQQVRTLVECNVTRTEVVCVEEAIHRLGSFAALQIADDSGFLARHVDTTHPNLARIGTRCPA